MELWLIKIKLFWTMPEHSDCSLTWRSLLKIKFIARPIVEYITSSTILWLHNGHPIGHLIDAYGPRRLELFITLALHWLPKFLLLLTNGAWVWDVWLARNKRHLSASKACIDPNCFAWPESRLKMMLGPRLLYWNLYLLVLFKLSTILLKLCKLDVETS